MTNVTTSTHEVQTLSTILGILHAQAAAVGEATATAATVAVNVWFDDAPMAHGEFSLARHKDEERAAGRFVAAGDSPDAWLSLPLRGALFDLKDDEYARACTLLEECAARAVAVHVAALESEPAARPLSTIERICEGHDVNDARRETLLVAIALGANDKILVAIRDAARVSRKDTIVLPPGRFEHLSRGKGWARLGQGNNVTWGERDEKGYRVGPGKWTVGSNDGFNRKDSVSWNVEHITVGAETWTVAS